jgi:NNP family nitrate/nitrite transporter-like MFS transporter
VAYVSRFYPAGKQGTALGIFGVGNVGAAVTKFVAPFVLIAWGWESVALVWATVLALVAIVFWFTTTDDPVIRARREGQAAPARPFLKEFEPLRDIRVWRFSLYYFFTFGAFVALSLWLPRYLVGVYGFDLKVAGMIGAAYSIPGSIFRAYGGVLSDKVGARRVLFWTFGVSAVCTMILSAPATFGAADGSVTGSATLAWPVFLLVIAVLGFFMAIGKAAVYKHIPVYYPDSVGAVGGLVGMIGGLGGFVLPLAFGALKDATGSASSCFVLLFLLVAVSLLWMTATVRRLNAAPSPLPAE